MGVPGVGGGMYGSFLMPPQHTESAHEVIS